MGDFNPHYLKYLAALGSTNLHAFQDGATELLHSNLSLRPGYRVLEIGCGTGQTMLKLSIDNQVIVDGVDVLDEMLAVARLRLSLCGGSASMTNLVRADATEGLPFQNDSYDAVFTESVLGIHEACKVQTVLAEIHRVLKPGGRFVANEGLWKAGTPLETIRAITESCTQDFGFAPVADSCWVITDWLKALEGQGFNVISAELMRRPPAQNISRSLATLRSRLLTFAFRLKAKTTLRLRRQTVRYKARIERHRSDHEHIEIRLFVATKVGSNLELATPKARSSTTLRA